MDSLIKKIIVGNKILTFFFTGIDDVSYYVEVLEKERNVYSFIMKENQKGEWEIEGKENHPSYLEGVEAQLSDTINKNKAN
jgi:hypothetical protein